MGIISFGGILLPPENADLKKWSVVACDQFSSQPSYWEKIKEEVGNEPSSLSLICPECYLSDVDNRLSGIREKSFIYAEKYLTRKTDAVLVKRKCPGSDTVRTGLVCRIDLEEYDYHAGSTSKVHATEKTVEERIPPRLKVKESSRLDLPHVICLINDKDVLESAEKGRKLYGSELNGGGGYIEGYEVKNLGRLEMQLNELEKKTDGPFILVGDGNHSLASGKAYYEKLKKENSPAAAKARYALVEIESIYDEGVKFEPIHRIIFSSSLAEKIKEELNTGVKTRAYLCGKEDCVFLPEDSVEAYVKVTGLLDRLARETGAAVDYIHGEDSLRELSGHGFGIVMPSLKKEEFFGLIKKHSVLPKKTFSMGEANEKRYYLEAVDYLN